MSEWIFRLFGRDRNILAAGIVTVVWSIWKTRNTAVFEHVYPYDPTFVMFKVVRFINDCAGLQRASVRLAQRLAKVVSECFSRRSGWALVTRRIGVG